MDLHNNVTDQKIAIGFISIIVILLTLYTSERHDRIESERWSKFMYSMLNGEQKARLDKEWQLEADYQEILHEMGEER